MTGGGPVDRSVEAPLAALLAADFTAYTYDRRGRGQTADSAPHSVDREFEDIQVGQGCGVAAEGFGAFC